MYCGQAVRVQTPADAARLSRLAAATPPPLAEKVRAASLLAGERRHVTVLFIDVVGSTSLADQLDVEAWSVLMNGALDRIAPVIYRYEGSIAHMLGDSLVAFFGAPVAHEDDPLRAVMAALDVMEVAREYGGIARQQYGVEFALRACLNYGMVVIGEVGEDLKYEVASVGEAINLAARLKFAAKPNTVLVAENVERFISPFFECQDMGIIEVKGRAEPVHACQVLGYKTEPGSLRGLVGLESPMVGRLPEMRKLEHLCEAVKAGLGRAVMIIGEPGMGKTRLIAEWKVAIACRTEPHISLWIEGHSHSYAQGMVYHLLHHLIHSLLGVPTTGNDVEVEAALNSLVSELFGASDVSPGLDVYAPLAHMLSLDLHGVALEAMRAVDIEALQARYISALRKLLETLAVRRPIALVLDDLHWADPSSIEVLIKLLPMVYSSPVLFCIASRPDRDSAGWKLVGAARELLGDSLTEITLDALSDQETRQLVSNLLAIEALPEDLRGLILRKAEGNPYFVEEIIRMLIEHKAIVPQDGGWVAGEGIGSVVVPDNLVGLLMARIDRLPEEGRRILRVASVVGRQFPVRVLVQVLGDGTLKAGDGSTAVISTLSSLENAGLVRIARVEPDLEYLFRHTLVQEAAYSSLLVADRKRLHQSVGQAVEKLYPDQLGEFSAMLAYHFDQAGLDERAIRYFTLAGQTALDSYANQEAEDHFRRALALTRSDAQRAELLSGLGQALNREGRIQEAIQLWLEAIRLFRALGDFNAVASIYSRAARAAWHVGDTPGGLRLCQEGMLAVEGAPESPEMARLLHETARAYYFNGIPAQAAPLCQQALEMAERLGAVREQADALATLGLLPDQPPGEAIASLEKAVELSEANQNYRVSVRAHINLATVRRGLLGDNRGASQHYERAVEVARMRGVPQEQLLALASALGVALALGELDRVERTLPEVELLVKSLPDPGTAVGELRSLKSALLAMRGDWQASLELVRLDQAEARRRGDLQAVFNADTFLVVLLSDIDHFVASPDWSEAEEALREAIEIGDRGIGAGIGPRSLLSIVYSRKEDFQEARHWLDELRQIKITRTSIWDDMYLLMAEAELARAEERWKDAQAAYEALAEINRRTEQIWDWARALHNLAEVLVARGEAEDFARAQMLYSQALEIYRKMGAFAYAQIIEGRQLALQMETESQVLAAQQVSQEMAQAGKVQSSFLPAEIPRFQGWSLAAVLEPARQTSGDYYDFIPLSGGLLGIVVADVTDKGAGAALFMASSRTLIRTYADAYPARPEQVITAANRRLVLDTHAGLYITVFYGVLNTVTGVLDYCNAGHNPPYLFKAGADGEMQSLAATGMPLGILAESRWTQANLQLEHGDVLVLYTDGVTEAQDEHQALFGDQRLIQSARRSMAGDADQPRPAQAVHAELLADIHQFVGRASRSDDLTLMVIRREG
jgi:serine phosphatase RsbU (regulator of sigma subunit)/class 3 adenylate cyclase